MAGSQGIRHAHNFNDLTGRRFGHWTVLYIGAARGGKHRWWVCRCNCPAGTVREVFSGSLLNGDSTSCGCHKRAVTSRVKTKHGQARAGRQSKEWRAWNAMIRRCTYPSMDDYPRYGGRGIRVCDEWRKSFAAFLADVGPSPSPRHTLDRIDSDGHYEPGNVRWATPTEQGRNTRRNRHLVHDGKTLCVTEWAEVTGIDRRVIEYRLRAGWPVSEALTLPVVPGQKVRRKPR